MLEVQERVFPDNKRLVHFIFSDQIVMNQYFKRFSEFIESPTLKGKVFSVDEIYDVYPDYDVSVFGHNIPGNKLEEFKQAYAGVTPSGVINVNERCIYMQLEDYDLKDVYVIATCKGKGFDAINHEIAHAMYYLIPKYQHIIDFSMYTFMTHHIEGDKYFNDIFDILEYKAYDKDVWRDEAHATLIDLGFGDHSFFHGRDFRGKVKQFFAGKRRGYRKYIDLGNLLCNFFKIYYELGEKVE